MIVEEILSDEDVTPIPPSLPGVHIEEIDEQFVTEGMVYYIYIYIFNALPDFLFRKIVFDLKFCKFCSYH